ncbi:MAG: L,D-transpeptidase [Ignavibacteriaceae bacterium]|nr:L,D-transpeptidase [Ignavibacteriaceae bacterium]
MNSLKSILFILTLSISCIANAQMMRISNGLTNSNEKAESIPDYSKLKDTLYTDKDYFIEIDLNTQMGYLHSRFEGIREFGISSGTTRLKDGIKTNEGVFVIQFKSPRMHSVQFDSTLMLNWMGFNYGIGFHALLGNSYYKYLGVKVSSHGCVRVSREDAKDIYSKVSVGTPVLVRSGNNNAVAIAFTNKGEYFSYLSYGELKGSLNERFRHLYNGNYLLKNHPKLRIDQGNVTHAGLPIGSSGKIHRWQAFKPFYKFIANSLPVSKKPEQIKFAGNSYLKKFRLKKIAASNINPVQVYLSE